MIGEHSARDLIRASEALIDVIGTENAALARMDLSRVKDVAIAKLAAVEAYENQLGAFADLAGGREQLSPAVNDALRRSCEALADAVTANVSALRGAMELNRRLVRTIAQSVENMQPVPSGYTQAGLSRQQTVLPGKSAATPVSLDETL